MYAELHAVAHTQKETIVKVEARWEKAVGRTQLLLKGQPLQMMTKQVIKELEHQPLQVSSVLCASCFLLGFIIHMLLTRMQFTHATFPSS